MADKGRERKEIADELEQYLSEGDADKIFSDDDEDEEFEEAEKKVEEIPEEPELTEEEPVLEPQDLPEEEESTEEEPEEEPELPEEKVEEPEEEEEKLEAEVKTKEELDEELDKEIEEEEKAKPKKEAPAEREKTIIEKMSCDSLATVNGYLIGLAAIEFAFFYALSSLLALSIVLRTELDGFFKTARSLLLQSLECFAFTVVLFLVASLFNNILKERKGKIGLVVLLFGEIILIGCFLAQIIIYAKAVLLM